ncbi:MAG: single-stranded DNA-binding protein [Candidatus Gribaldobacteria bacterium]|nr:single-stranded DNA-binding protein [Candidatus Gribaldobacteria bacterium]
MNLNKVFVLGNVTRDPEKKALPSGQAVVNFSIATNRFYKDQAGQKQQDTEFHNIVMFGKLAETASLYLKQGSLILIEGRLKTRNWQDQAGVKHYRTEVVAEGMQLGPRGNAGAGDNSNFAPKNAYQSQPNRNASIKDEEIPIIEEEAVLDSLNEPEQEEIDVKNIPF